MTTIAGFAGSPGSANGDGSAARFQFPWAVAVDAAGRLFVADNLGPIVRRIVAGTVTTIGGAPGSLSYADGSGAAARFHAPSGIAVDAQGNLYLTQHHNNIVAKGVIETPPVIATQPQSIAVPAGAGATLSVTATGPGLLYQWRLNGNAIPGATAATYVIAAAGLANTGDYTVEVANGAGAVASAVATLTIATAGPAGRIVNLSILTALAGAGDAFTLGLVVGGSGTSGRKPLVIRAAGPALGALGVPGTLADPQLELFAGGARTGGNDNWGGGAPLALAMQNVGAFPYAGPASRDAAVAAEFEPGDQTVRVSAADGGSGAVIAEIYDATPPGAFAAGTPRLVNVSVLKQLGSGLTAGFVIGGPGPRRVLMRAVGPTLGAAPFNVPGAVADPQLTLYSGPAPLRQNDNWGGTAELAAAFAQVGAFALAAVTRDAAIVADLAPGSYTVEVRGVNGADGLVLVEIYEVP